MAKDTKQHWRARTGTTRRPAKVRDEYVRKNGDLFREILRMFNAKSEAGKTLMLQIQDEFDNDHVAPDCCVPGFEAEEQTEADEDAESDGEACGAHGRTYCGPDQVGESPPGPLGDRRAAARRAR